MKLLLVGVPLEFPLALYCLASHLAATLPSVETTILCLDPQRLHSYTLKQGEIWKYIAAIEADKPDLIAFSVYLWSHLPTKELLALTRVLYPAMPLIVGGPELATEASVSEFVGPSLASAAVRGEGEATMSDVVERLANGQGLRGVPGVSWHDGASVVHETPRMSTKNLEGFASPYLSGWIPDDLFDRETSHARGRFPRAFIETYRGCYMHCSYCQWGVGSKARFEFPYSRVLAELSWLIERRVSCIWIVDAMFGFKKATAKAILSHIVEEKARYGARTRITCYHNQDFFDTELFDLYREANVMVEVDLQSTNRDVLARAGRAKWFLDSFERHVDAFHSHGVPTTGGADLIMGLPRDSYESFAQSVDYMLRRRMKINLFQLSMIPNTPMEASAEDDGTAFSPVPPRAVYRNRTFSVNDMVRARLLGHGVQFFALFPRTAELLWLSSYSRPVDLCEAIGRLLWERHGLMYSEPSMGNRGLFDHADLVESLLGELCNDVALAPAILDVFRLEVGLIRGRRPPQRRSNELVRGSSSGLPTTTEGWLESRLTYHRNEAAEVSVTRNVERLLSTWRASGALPELNEWRALDTSLKVAIPLPLARAEQFCFVDRELTLELLKRANGYFTVIECLRNAGCDVAGTDLASLFAKIELMATHGLISVESSAGDPSQPSGGIALSLARDGRASGWVPTGAPLAQTSDAMAP